MAPRASSARKVPRIVVLAALLALVALAGCLGGDKRSDWAYDDAGIEDLNDTGLTGAGVTIALLDTGINTGHPALDHLIDGNHGNGELIAFRDFLGNANGPREAYDDAGHGSHVAGIIAARSSSDLSGGIALKGGAPQALLVVGRVCDELCDARVIPQAIAWAVDQGADIISLSLGGQFNLTLADTTQRLSLEAAIDGAIDAGVVVVASAGNQGAAASDVESPADIPGVIAVGSIGRGGLVSNFSSRGSPDNNVCRPLPELPDLPLPILLPQVPTLPRILPIVLSRCDPDQKPEVVAPGEDITSAWAGTAYYRASGTSQAAPFVTSAVALLLQGRPDLTSRLQVEQVKQALVDSARPIAGQDEPHDDSAGYGALDAAGLLAVYDAR